MLPLPGVMSGAGAQAGQSDPRLKPAAHEFEACLMKEFLEPLQHDALFDDNTDPGSSGGSGNALMSFGSEALARAISERGGFGIATEILKHLDGKAEAAGAAGAAGGAAAAGSENFLRMGREK